MFLLFVYAPPITHLLFPLLRFFMGKNKVMSLALGRTPEEEQKPGLHKVAQEITGSRGLLFTNSQLQDVEK